MMAKIVKLKNYRKKFLKVKKFNGTNHKNIGVQKMWEKMLQLKKMVENPRGKKIGQNRKRNAKKNDRKIAEAKKAIQVKKNV